MFKAKSWWTKVGLVSLVVFNAVDAAFTHFVVGGKYGRELNPFSGAIYDSSPVFWVGVKMFISTLAAVLLWPEAHLTPVRSLVKVSVIGYALLVAYQCLMVWGIYRYGY
jgi:hypothetical protein